MRSPLAYAQPRPGGEGRRDGRDLARLFAPLEWLLASGGDGRLALAGPARLNRYGCALHPVAGILAFASSTASTISQRGFARADAARHALLGRAIEVGFAEAFDSRLEAMRGEFLAIWGIGAESCDVVWAPSGTDAQLLALFAAQTALGGAVETIVVAADETGSGAAFTAEGRHFDTRTALDVAVAQGAAIAGLSCPTTAVRLTNEDGTRRTPDEIDAAVAAAIAKARARGRGVVVHAMDSSKFGRRAPSRSLLDALDGARDVVVVVDACQARLGRDRLKAQLARGRLVLLTGSKFFGGPAFSGALLVPPRLGEAVARATPPTGLIDYTARSDWPAAWTALRAHFLPEPNFGLWLRWEAALAEMAAYFAVPQDARAALLADFATGVGARLSASTALAPLPTHAAEDDDSEFASPTIFPFVIRRGGAPIPAEECAAIHRALYRDLSLDFADDDARRHLAATLCHIGQPVRLKSEGVDTAALRISAGARLVSDCRCEGARGARRRLAAALDDVATAIRKIELLVAHPEITSKGIA